jgi:hypothetical protein
MTTHPDLSRLGRDVQDMTSPQQHLNARTIRAARIGLLLRIVTTAAFVVAATLFVIAATNLARLALTP